MNVFNCSISFALRQCICSAISGRSRAGCLPGNFVYKYQPSNDANQPHARGTFVLLMGQYAFQSILPLAQCINYTEVAVSLVASFCHYKARSHTLVLVICAALTSPVSSPARKKVRVSQMQGAVCIPAFSLSRSTLITHKGLLAIQKLLQATHSAVGRNPCCVAIAEDQWCSDGAAQQRSCSTTLVSLAKEEYTRAGLPVLSWASQTLAFCHHLNLPCAAIDTLLHTWT